MQGDGRRLNDWSGYPALVVKECQGEVDALDLPEPALRFRPCPACEQVGLELTESLNHFRVEPEHRAPDACVLVRARRAVWPAAVSELDLAFVEGLFELCPFLAGRGPVLLGGAKGSPSGEVRLVVADDVFLEDRDVAARGLDVEVAEQGRANVNGQTAVDQLSCQKSPEILRAEVRGGEGRMRLTQLVAQPAQTVGDRTGAHGLAPLSDVALEQEWLRLGRDPLVGVVAGGQRDTRPVGGEATDDARDDVEQLSRHGDDPFAVALGRGDDQKRDDLAVGSLVLPHGQLRQFEYFLDAGAGVAQGLDDGPLPEGGVFFQSEVAGTVRVLLQDADVRVAAGALVRTVGLGE